MRNRLCLILILLLFCGVSCVQAASITANTDTVTATDVPENSTLLVGLFRDNTLIDISAYQGSGTITGKFAEDMSISEATDIKAFLWDMESLTPLCNAFSSKTEDLPSEGNILVVYYSRTETTKSLAETVHSISGGDIVRIETVNSYPEDYSECLAQVQQEQAEDYRPSITVDLETIEQYDTILLGYPIWYNSLPTPVVTFLTTYDLSGKTIIPFCTSGSTSITGSVSKLKTLCPNSTIANGFRGTSSSSASQVASWLKENGLSI
ncbi:MAG: hypothetical protein LIO53_02785 [Oscillospiraceae bacterium]|nr:hypothetical protein [Oscillospiraceae bacterium]